MQESGQNVALIFGTSLFFYPGCDLSECGEGGNGNDREGILLEKSIGQKTE